MLEHDVHSETADTVFLRKAREKLAARGYHGSALEQKLGELMRAPVRFKFDLEDAAGQDSSVS